MTNWSPFGDAWNNDLYLVRPAEVRMVMRDTMKLHLSEMAAAEVLLSFRGEPNEFLVWASLKTIADRAGLPRSTASYAVRQLMKKGLITEEARATEGQARWYGVEPLVTQLALARAAWEAKTRRKLRTRQDNVFPMRRHG